MPYIIQWTENAVICLERLYLFLASHDENAARAAIDAIRNRVPVLEKFPHAGRLAKDMDQRNRELFVPFGSSGYVILYHFEDSIIYILAIRHQKEAGY